MNVAGNNTGNTVSNHIKLSKYGLRRVMFCKLLTSMMD